MKRLLAVLLSLSLLLSVIPIQTIAAEKSGDAYQFVLDTDGIDARAEYMIVSASEGEGYALRMDGTTPWQGAAQSVSISDGTIEAFENDTDSVWLFSGSSGGSVSNHNYYLHIMGYVRFETTSNALNFAHFGEGRYGIYINSEDNNLQYLSYTENGEWKTTYRYGASGENISSYENGVVYLFKKVPMTDVTYSVSYHGNGHTSGSVPEGVAGLKSGDKYVVQSPTGDLKKIDENGDEHIFRSWNTAADGSGTDYVPGDILTMEHYNVVLYARWYAQTKHKVTVVTNLDNVQTDVDEILGKDVSVCISEDGQTFIELSESDTGVYEAAVAKNGVYYVYFKDASGQYEQVHNHQVIIYNQSSSTVLQNYSVTYKTDANEQSPEGDTKSWKEISHANQSVLVTDVIPTKAGYTFAGWKDSDDKIYKAGEVVRETLTEPVVLTAQWEEAKTVTINITINHTAGTGGFDTDDQKHHVDFQLLQLENEVNHPVPNGAVSLDETDQSFHTSADGSQTTYQYVFSNMPDGNYNVSTSKSGYEVAITKSVDGKTINVVYTYAPSNFDLQFCVQMADAVPQELYPQAVNVKVLVWGYNAQNQLGWNVITQQEGSSAPFTVKLDADGHGSGFYPVWKLWPAEGNHEYEYRIEVTSYVMPDGSVVPAKNTDEYVTYVTDGSGLYTGTVAVENGRIPEYPQGSVSGTSLKGAYYDDNEKKQIGTPTLTVTATPFSVTFDAGTGKLQGDRVLTLTNQYRYPNLNLYIPEAGEDGKIFAGWYIGDTAAENSPEKYLTSDVVYTAKWIDPRQVTGTVTIAGTYQQDGQIVFIHEQDRATEVMAVLQKLTNDVYNDVQYQLLTFPADYKEIGTAEYHFSVPDDGAHYRIQLLELNYSCTYDNNADDAFSVEQSEVLFGDSMTAVVDVHLAFEPAEYVQYGQVDASRIHSGYRPSQVLVEVMVRDIGSENSYTRISQHDVPPYGVETVLDEGGYGVASDGVWNWHTDGTLYEYQMNISKLYGNIEGVFTAEGKGYDKDSSPYTIHYGASAWFKEENNGESNPLKAMLIPNEYEVIFDLGYESEEVVAGMEHYVTDSGNGHQKYSYSHTWSYEDHLVAFPYRTGYVFKGWACSHEGVFINNGGYLTIAAGLGKDVTLTAQWEKIDGIAYTVRYLEQNTDDVLQGAKIVDGLKAGDKINTREECVSIAGYKYVGVQIGTTYYELDKVPDLTLSEDHRENRITVYYLPDGSDGYTDQVESNLYLDKTATLEDNGTYTITMETYTTDNPITTQIQQNTPLDIVLVLDQSGSIINSGYLDDLQAAVDNFISLIAEHGRENEVDHRIAMVGYAGDEDEPPTSTNTSTHPIAGGTTSNWVNTGVFDSNGDFHPYPVTGFNYSPYQGNPEATGTYYAKSGEEYLLLMHHDVYYHLISEEEAKTELLRGVDVYGYADGGFVKLTRNLSGLWLYGEELLYSSKEFFTYHKDVWTHRKGLEKRQIHAYGTGEAYTSIDGHTGLYVRTETRDADPMLNVYKDALVPVSVGAQGSGSVNPGLLASANRLGSNGGTYVQYGIEMANKIFENNPLDVTEGRVRIMVMFTDGLPGIGTFDESEANAAIRQAYIAKNTHDAYSYNIGLYPSSGSSSTSDVSVYMNAVSSNYPKAQSMDDVYTPGSYYLASNGANINDGQTYYVRINTGSWLWPSYTYYQLSYGTFTRTSDNKVYTGWYYVRDGSYYLLTTTANAAVDRNNEIGGNKIALNTGGYKETPHSGYYATTDSEKDLKSYFEHIVQEITTKITNAIVLHQDTILRDIMGQGLELTAGTVITAYRQAGTYNAQTKGVDWAVNADGTPILEKLADLELSGGNTASEEKAIMTDTFSGEQKEVPYIQVYNLDKENTTDPESPEYHPHAVDITGYDFSQWYINGKHPSGYKIVVEVTRIEARDNVKWGRSMLTNNNSSGLWLPADATGARELLMRFEQPNTIFVERAYVLDYGKPFTLSGWYYDKAAGNDTVGTVHIDSDISNGMNWFDQTAPSVSSGLNGSYGNVAIKDGVATYTPTTMQWDGTEQFYIFGDTQAKNVVSQDANENGNLWTKVSVIPANSIYYEDSFVTYADKDVNGVDGFQFSGNWTTVYTKQSSQNAHQNVEKPEHQEDAMYGGIHGWIDDMDDDQQYSDGSAHMAGQNQTMGANVEFTFTGTGVDIYTRTNDQSGMVVATLKQLIEEVNEDGTVTVKEIAKPGIVMDNLAVSGDYYQIPTISFNDLEYGTYKVKLIATAASDAATGEKRFEYYLDGIRVYNPLSSNQINAPEVIRDAYGNEQNAVFTEVRDILLDYKDFNTDMTDSTDGKAGAVFIDWIRAGQNKGDDDVAEGTPSYEIGTFLDYGPKNEVYLTTGQHVVLKVDPNNTYYVGLKSLDGKEVTSAISGLDTTKPVKITFEHSTDMYYQVVPVDGYIVIGNISEVENGADGGPILSITKLRTTNLDGPAKNGGIVPVTKEEALNTVELFTYRLQHPELIPSEGSGMKAEVVGLDFQRRLKELGYLE